MLESIYAAFLKSTGVSTDTRSIAPGSIFFCLKGGNFDGNKFAAEALEKGASFVVIDNADYTQQDRSFLVEDVLHTLQDLALHHRRQFHIPVLGITGSNGKTTSKELITAVLQTTYNVLSTHGNLNNHIGVPLTLLRLTSEHQLAVIEMGANKPGDIQELCEIAEPTHGIITNVGRAHLEGFGSLEGVLETKTALYRSISGSEGKLFVNSDDTLLTGSLPKEVQVSTYGDKGEVSGELIRLDPFVNMTWKQGDYTSPELKMQLVGKYNFTNFLAAVCIGLHFEVSREKINAALTSYSPSNNRSQIAKTEKNTLIVDCYNANPTSMSSALESFAAIEHPNKFFILGDMREMGKESLTVHREIRELAEKLDLQGALVGEEFAKVKSPGDFQYFKSSEDVKQWLISSPIQGSLILLKGSRGIQLETLLPFL